MKYEDIKQSIMDLSDEEKLRLIQEVGPTICEAIMSRPHGMQSMMPMCQEMMSKRPEMMARMREMMMGKPKE